MKKIIISTVVFLSLILSSCGNVKSYKIKSYELVGQDTVIESIMYPKMVLPHTQIYSTYKVVLENDSVIEYRYKGTDLNLNLEKHTFEVRNNDYTNYQLVYNL